MSIKPIITLDRIRGMFMGVFLSDSLGVPHEFKCNSNTPYTGILEHKGFMVSRFQGRKEFPIGAVSDDSELTITLLRCIITNKGYDKDQVILSYLKWANSGSWMMGKNTRALMKGVTTIKGYKTRIDKVLALPMSERSQSNGALMRCSPLALLFDNNIVIEDVSITNPNLVCFDTELIYITALRLALQGIDGQEIFRQISPLAQTNEVKQIIAQVQNREQRDISENKGWCLHGLWCALIVITSDMNYSDAMRFIITHKGSDTDTNACIAGALLGAKLGFDNLNKEPDTARNIQILLNTNNADSTHRPIEFLPHDFYSLTEAAHSLTL